MLVNEFMDFKMEANSNSTILKNAIKHIGWMWTILYLFLGCLRDRNKAIHVLLTPDKEMSNMYQEITRIEKYKGTRWYMRGVWKWIEHTSIHKRCENEEHEFLRHTSQDPLGAPSKTYNMIPKGMI